MAKSLELNKWDAIDRLVLFMKLRKNKTITDRTISDFSKLTDKMSANFKSYNYDIISEEQSNDMDVMKRVCECLSSDFIKFDAGGVFRKSDISKFAFYKDEKYRAKINEDEIEISKSDFNVLKYLFGVK